MTCWNTIVQRTANKWPLVQPFYINTSSRKAGNKQVVTRKIVSLHSQKAQHWIHGFGQVCFVYNNHLSVTRHSTAGSRRWTSHYTFQLSLSCNLSNTTQLLFQLLNKTFIIGSVSPFISFSPSLCLPLAIWHFCAMKALKKKEPTLCLVA